MRIVLRIAGALAMLTALNGVASGQAAVNFGLYDCGTEKVFVDRCHDGCHVAYVDRRNERGYTVERSEAPQALAETLQACKLVEPYRDADGRTSFSPSSSTASPQQKPHTSTAGTPRGPLAQADPANPVSAGFGEATIPPPGVGNAEWKFAAYTDTKALVFTEPLVQPWGNRKRGWFTEILFEPGKSQGRDYQYLQGYLEADCAANSIMWLEVAPFTMVGEALWVSSVTQEPTNPSPGTIGEVQLNLLCGRPQELVFEDAIEGDAVILWDLALLLREAEEKQDLQKQQ